MPLHLTPSPDLSLDATTLAKLDEARNALDISEIADEHLKVNSGVAARGAPKTWINTCIGLAMDGPISRDEVDAVTRWYHEKDLDAKIEVCDRADESLLKHLGDAGYRMKFWEHVFARAISPTETITSPHPLGDGLRLETIPRSDTPRAEQCARAVAEAFATSERPPTPADVELTLRCIRHPRVTTIAAFEHDRCIGCGFVQVHNRIAALFAGAVSPDYRRRGVQLAMLTRRLAIAQAAGASIATIGGSPGAATERNTTRMGFRLAYAKVHVVKLHTPEH
jgi:GNAT superfamily N-acetyltransferase